MKKIVFVVPLLALSLLASCEKTPVKKYEVTATSGVTVSNTIAYSNKDYETTLAIDEAKMVLANEPIKVTINGSESTNYTYKLKDSKNEASFSIQKEYITGPINIELDFGYPVICSNKNVIFTKTIAAKNKKYETELTSAAPYALPDKLTKVIINGKEADYKYVPDMARHATLSIEENVTGPIEIELVTEKGHSIFCSSSDVTFSKRIVLENQKYETDLTIKNDQSGISFPSTKDGIKVRINGIDINDFTYTYNDSTHASFSVEGTYATGDIIITIPLIYAVTCNESTIVIENKTAVFGSDYETTLSVNDQTKGLSDFIKVTIGKFVIDANDYTYTPNPNDLTKASLLIPSQRIKGPISLELVLGDAYAATIEVITGQTVTLEKTAATPVRDYETEISFDKEMYNNLKMPTTLKSVTSGGSSVENYEYIPDPNDTSKATLKIDKSQIVGNIEITIEFRWFDYEDWWNYCSSDDEKVKATEADIGREVTASVIALKHNVRLIGIDHDNLVSGGKAHCTFEFSNVLTVSWLPSRTKTNWNVKDGIFSTNYEYRESTLNDFLNDKGYTGSVINMLPDSLQSAIKLVDKKVGVSTDNGRTYTAVSFDAKTHLLPYLFPLAHDEMIDNQSSATIGEGSKYQYYANHSAQEYRIKKAVDGGAKEYWLRSPNASGRYMNYAWAVGENGFIYEHYGNVSSSGFAVAPAFCI